MKKNGWEQEDYDTFEKLSPIPLEKLKKLVNAGKKERETEMTHLISKQNSEISINNIFSEDEYKLTAEQNVPEITKKSEASVTFRRINSDSFDPEKVMTDKKPALTFVVNGYHDSNKKYECGYSYRIKFENYDIKEIVCEKQGRYEWTGDGGESTAYVYNDSRYIDFINSEKAANFYQEFGKTLPSRELTKLNFQLNKDIGRVFLPSDHIFLKAFLFLVNYGDLPPDATKAFIDKIGIKKVEVGRYDSSDPYIKKRDQDVIEILHGCKKAGASAELLYEEVGLYGEISESYKKALIYLCNEGNMRYWDARKQMDTMQRNLWEEESYKMLLTLPPDSTPQTIQKVANLKNFQVDKDKIKSMLLEQRYPDPETRAAIEKHTAWRTRFEKKVNSKLIALKAISDSPWFCQKEQLAKIQNLRNEDPSEFDEIVNHDFDSKVLLNRLFPDSAWRKNSCPAANTLTKKEEPLTAGMLFGYYKETRKLAAQKLEEEKIEEEARREEARIKNESERALAASLAFALKPLVRKD